MHQAIIIAKEAVAQASPRPLYLSSSSFTKINSEQSCIFPKDQQGNAEAAIRFYGDAAG
jgi:hypothetical protein